LWKEEVGNVCPDLYGACFLIFTGERRVMPREGRDFQGKLIRELRYRLPGCVILKNDANYLQGVPDILILWEDTWAALECKIGAEADREANQIYYVNLMNGMSFAAFIYPANKDDVLHDLQRTLELARRTRVSQT
jgi:hypothetical protein